MKITKTIFDEGKISLGKVLEGYELKKTDGEFVGCPLEGRGGGMVDDDARMEKDVIVCSAGPETIVDVLEIHEEAVV